MNETEGVAAEVWRSCLPDDPEPPIWIEHYPVAIGDSTPPPWQRVDFRVVERYILTEPHCWPISLAELQELVGQHVDPYRDPDSRIPSPPRPDPFEGRGDG